MTIEILNPWESALGKRHTPGYEEERPKWKQSPGAMARHLAPRENNLPARHLDKLDEYIVEAIETGGRLIVELPVRHGKSVRGSHWTPVYVLERWAHKKVILASYEASFAAKWGRAARNTILENKSELDVRLAPDITSSSEWETTEGGGMITAGVGGPINGRGADVFVIDDPIKNAEEAASVVIRDRIWEWWTSTAYTRVEPGGAIIILMARWHRDDLVGRLKNPAYADDVDAEDWKILSMPALATNEYDFLGRQEGDALWPERRPANELRKIKRAVGKKVWGSLYQQNPQTSDSEVFKRSWFEIVKDYPRDANTVRGWDFAATEKKSKRADPDWTVGIKVAEKDGVFYVILKDMVRLRSTPKTVRDTVRNTAIADGLTVKPALWQDPGQAGVEQAQTYKTEVLKGFSYLIKVASQSKEIYAEPVSVAAQAENIKVVCEPGDPNLEVYLSEHEDFPDGGHDDIIDAESRAFHALAHEFNVGGGLPVLSGTQVNRWGGAASGDALTLIAGGRS